METRFVLVHTGESMKATFSLLIEVTVIEVIH